MQEPRIAVVTGAQLYRKRRRSLMIDKRIEYVWLQRGVMQKAQVTLLPDGVA